VASNQQPLISHHLNRIQQEQAERTEKKPMSKGKNTPQRGRQQVTPHETKRFPRVVAGVVVVAGLVAFMLLRSPSAGPAATAGTNEKDTATTK
jgi:hypothetical protein